MKKYLICFISIFALGILALLNVQADEASSANVEEINTLVSSYFNEGVYTKNTEIYLTDSAVSELEANAGFHAGASDLVRLTRYNGDTLTMTIPGNSDYESNYGTDANGNLTHWSKGGTPTVAAKKPSSADNAGLWRDWDEDGMEGYYWTLKDIVATASHNWTVEDGVYTSNNSEVIEWFKAFVAPCYIGFNDNTKNYILLSGVSIEEVDHTLVLSLYADAQDSTKLTSGSELFAQAVVREGYTYFLTENTVASSKLEGEGTKSAPYLINNEADFLYFKQSVEAGNDYKGLYVELVNNIDVARYEGFMIGNYFDSTDLKAFSGHLNGARHLVSGLNINNTTTTNYATGLIACLGTGGSISNLTVDGTIAGLTKVGGIAGRASGPIKNCINNADVTGEADVGGVVGYVLGTSSTLSHCVNNGNVNGTQASDTQTGGIAGVSQAKVEYCVNNGNVSGYHVVGGVVSYLGAAGSHNVNYGNVEGNNCIGGIVGISGYSSHIGKQSYALSNSVNYGNVIGSKTYNTLRHIGGIVGYLYMNIDQCSNEGSIVVGEGVYYVGGITSRIAGTNSKVTNCYNSADIIAKNSYAVGGIVGYANVDCSIANCENEGNVSGKNLLGGILGHADAGVVSISECTNSGSVTGTSNNVAGILGSAYSNAAGTVVDKCTNNGNVTASQDVGGVTGYLYGSNKTVSNCVNNGNVTATGSAESVGGIVARTAGATASVGIHKVLNCTNNGDVTGANSKWVGGIIGILGSQSTVDNCHNTGNIYGSTIVGGINGSMYSTSTVTNCTNTGNVTAKKDYVAGISAYISGTNSKISGCITSGVVKSELTSGTVHAGMFIGGPVATSNQLTVSNNTSTGSFDLASGVTGYDKERGSVTADYTQITFSGNTVE